MWASLWDPAFEEELFEVSLGGVWVDDKGRQGGVDAGTNDWVDVLVDESQHHTALCQEQVHLVWPCLLCNEAGDWLVRYIRMWLVSYVYTGINKWLVS